MREFSSNKAGKGISPDRSGGLASDCDWLSATWQTLFQNDDRGRITRSEAQRWGRVPIFQLGRTRHGNLWRVARGVPGPVATRLARLAAREAVLGEAGPPWTPCERQGAIRAVIGPGSRQQADCETIAFRLPEAKKNRAENSPASAGNGPRRSRFDAPRRRRVAQDEAHGPESVGRTVSMEGEEVVSICEPLVGAASPLTIAYMETELRWRRRGHASRALEDWLGRIRQAGGTPVFIADAARPEAQALAASVGMEAFAALTFWF
ncbi:MAG: hypothetical protein CBC48_00695 [bacterium TMED88]|nr:hypothetical protein [Deltaproteobacteria bacterium]OUV37333.1 MAG: hypothetical protein CBC48_00695 [bacterium TMED88]